ncbi:MAG: transposase [Flavobacteriales bacterium]|nr:transposase [Flavobacteriales bacterium]
MKNTRRKFTAAFKTQVVLEALKERKSLQELAAQYKLHPNQISSWKKEFLENAESAFGQHESIDKAAIEKEKDELYNQIGRLKMENDWLKKKVL